MFEAVFSKKPEVREAPYQLKQLLSASDKTQPSGSSRRVIESFPIDGLASQCVKAVAEHAAAQAQVAKAEIAREQVIKEIDEELAAYVSDCEEKRKAVAVNQARLMRQLADMGALEGCDVSAVLRQEVK